MNSWVDNNLEQKQETSKLIWPMIVSFCMICSHKWSYIFTARPFIQSIFITKAIDHRKPLSWIISNTFVNSQQT